MTRLIKFRGRDIDTGRFVYGYFFRNRCGDPCIATNRTAAYEVEPESVAQLVGYDKDGREVYEGDIVTNFVGEEFTAEILDGVITSEGAVDYVGGVEVLKLKEADNAHN